MVYLLIEEKRGTMNNDNKNEHIGKRVLLLTIGPATVIRKTKCNFYAS